MQLRLEDITRSYLNACCRDLLWILPTHHRSSRFAKINPEDYTIQFLHRTVYDFLGTTEMNEILDRFVPKHFHEDTFLLDVAVACLKVYIGRNRLYDDTLHPVRRFCNTIRPYLPIMPAKAPFKHNSSPGMSLIEGLSCQYFETFYDESDRI